jgi:hypothetical protein
MTNHSNKEEILKSITKEVVEQYELLRRSGICNMIDINCVASTSIQLAYKDLATFLGHFWLDGYTEILKNFDDLLKKYDIEQE